jgi:hypothetical protein
LKRVKKATEINLSNLPMKHSQVKKGDWIIPDISTVIMVVEHGHLLD